MSPLVSYIPVQGFFSPFSIIYMPVSYAVVGFISGAIGALLYNLVAKFVGGIKIELK